MFGSSVTESLGKHSRKMTGSSVKKSSGKNDRLVSDGVVGEDDRLVGDRVGVELGEDAQPVAENRLRKMLGLSVKSHQGRCSVHH